MQKFIEYLFEAEKKTKAIDHMLYVTFPLLKDQKLLLKVLSESKIVIADCINSILQYEYINKRIELTKDPKANFRLFKEKCAEKYGITEQEINLILDLFEIIELYKKSSFDFPRGNKIIIISENMIYKDIPIEKIKEFLILTKEILKKTKNGILRKI